LQESILGIAADQQGALWLATAKHVLRVRRDGLLRGTSGEAEVREFGVADGLPGVEGVKRFQSVVADSRGRIWFSLNRGLAVADPARLASYAAPALAHIETVLADGKLLDPNETPRIPAARQRLTFGFAGLCLAAPQQVRFRYKLDGFDADWSAPQAGREAGYTNLNPGAYRFRVSASNADGQWNDAEATLAFQIEPLFWQTWWFRLIGVLAGVLGILMLYRLRLRELTRQMNGRFEERLAERTRIAQDLHDTLLQGCISVSMQLHVALDQLPPGSAAQPLLNRVTQLLTQVIEAGRNAVHGLRATATDARDLQQAFARIRQELGVEHTAVDYRVIVEGRPRPLHPILRDDVYRIGREALVNAFRHAQATLIEVELEYAPQALRIVVRDDGCGIDPQVLRSGRAGHWGLAGMRERAERIGARLKIRSRAAAGTEVEMAVPGKIAFQESSEGVSHE
jgi:signal transduction histidine kinase